MQTFSSLARVPVALFAALLIAPLPAQELLRDINTQSADPDSDPSTPEIVGDEAFFSAFQPTVGRELFAVNTITGSVRLVANLNVGAASSSPRHITAAQGRLFFFATVAGTDHLHVHDIASFTTIRLRALANHERSGRPIVTVGPLAYCFASDGQSGLEPWVSDGTRGGTRQIADITPGPESTLHRGLVVRGREMYFAQSIYGGGIRNDRLVKVDIPTGVATTLSPTVASNNRFIYAPVPAGNRVVYEDRDVLWSTDGTVAGTAPIRVNGALLRNARSYRSAGPSALLAIAGPGSGTSYYITDGTDSGTRLLGTANAFLTREVVTFNGSVFFVGTQNLQDTLYAADLTGIRPVLTQQVTALVAGTTRLFVGVKNTAGHGELWTSDGTSAGTQQVTLLPGLMAQAAAAGDRVVFAQDDELIGNEPWLSDGTVAGTIALANLNAAVGTTEDSRPRQFARGPQGSTWFVANDSTQDIALWRTNGTTAQTSKVVLPNSVTHDHLQTAGDVLLYSDFVRRRPMLKLTDGTIAGTRQLATEWLQPGIVARSGLNSFVLADGLDPSFGVTGRAVVTIGPAGSTSATSLPSNLIDPRNPVALGQDLFLATGDASTGIELWSLRTQSIVRDIYPGSGSSRPGGALRIAFNRQLIFSANDGVTGVELWISDGTAAGTRRLADIAPDAASSQPSDPEIVGRWLYFVADDGSGKELWRTDGTSAGTTQVIDLIPGVVGSNPSDLTALGDTLVFVATNAIGSPTLWSTNSATNTTRLEKIFIETPVDLVAVGRAVYFRAQFGSASEIYRFDPTLSRQQVGRLTNFGSASDTSRGLALLQNGRVVFVADDGLSGQELWTLDPGAVAQFDSPGCGEVTLRASDPVLSQQTLGRISNVMPGAIGFIALGFPGSADIAPECRIRLRINLPVAVTNVTASSSGEASAAFAIPASTALAGLQLRMQAVVLASGGPLFGLELSNSVALRLGR